MRSLIWTLLVTIATVLSTALPNAIAETPAALSRVTDTAKDPQGDWRYVERRLTKAGLSPAFIAEMKKTYERESFLTVLRLNVLLYLRKTDDHGPQVNGKAVREVKSFISTNRKALARVEKQQGVPGPVVASLLWIESRHGRNLGSFHVPSVYLNLLQAERQPVISYLQREGSEFTGKPSVPLTAKQKKEIVERTRKKATWALAELKALERIHKWRWKIGPEMRGSFSGAFGMSQFLPSSYMKWARAKTEKAQPDLMKAEDAIYSVGYFLKDHGWKKGMEDTHVPALMEYNKSRDYANAILSLAQQAAMDGMVAQAGD